MPSLYYKQTDKHFNYIIKVITIKIFYLKYTPLIKKQLEQKKFLKTFSIKQKQAPSYNKSLSIFGLLTILKTFFSKIKIFIINNYDFNIKTQIG